MLHHHGRCRRNRARQPHGRHIGTLQDNARAFAVVTMTDDMGVVQFTPKTILQANGSRLLDLPMDHLLLLLLEVCDNAVLGEGTNEEPGLVAVLLAANEGGGNAVRSSAGISSSWWLA